MEALADDRLQRRAGHAAHVGQSQRRLVLGTVVGLHAALGRQPGKGALQHGDVAGDIEAVALGGRDVGRRPVELVAAGECQRAGELPQRA